MVDVHPDDLKTSTCAFPALFYVHREQDSAPMLGSRSW
jgi:hypothetical protein